MQILKFPIDLKSVTELPQLLIKVKDDNLISDTLLGLKTLDIQDILEKEGNWSFNKVIELEGDKKLLKKYNSFGSVYL